MISILVSLAALAFVDAAPAPEGGAPPAAAAAAPKPQAKGSDQVCWEEMPTGSHYPKRYCASRDELQARQQRDQDALNQKGRSPGAGSSFKPN